MLKKIGLIGGGYIGGVLTQEIAQRGLAREVGLSDPAPFVNPDDPPERQEVAKKQSVAKGKALDIFEGLPTIRKDVRCVASKDYSCLAGRRADHQHRWRAPQGPPGRHLPQPRGAARHQPQGYQ